MIVYKSYFKNILKEINQFYYNNNNDYTLLKSFNFNNLTTDNMGTNLQTSLKNNNYLLFDLDKHTYTIEQICTFLHNFLINYRFIENITHPFYEKVEYKLNSKFLINSSLAQPIHTDEGYTNKNIPRYVALYCTRAANGGGSNIFVKFQDVYQALLAKFGDLVDCLVNETCITVYGSKGRISKPLIYLLDDKTYGISYSTILQKLICEKRIFYMFDYLTRYVHTISNQIRFNLKEGQILLFDNSKMLHGRTSFNAKSYRLLHRFWFGAFNI